MNLVKDNLIDHFDENDVRFPCGLCDTHKRYINLLNQNLEGNSETRKPFDLEMLSLFLKSERKIRRKADSCECLVCRVAKSTGFNASLEIKKFQREVDSSSLQNNISPAGSMHRLCGKCLHPIGRGVRGHICNPTNLLRNVTNLFSDRIQERVASDIIKKRLGDVTNNNISLATGGKELKLNIHKGGDTSEKQITHEEISRMKKRMNLSQNQTLVLAEELRAVNSSRKVVASNLKQFLKKKNNELADIFEYEVVDGEEIIYCSDVPQHMVRVSRKRGHIEPKMTKIGLDGGQGTLKCAASYLYDTDEIFDSENSETAAKRRKYSDGLDVGKFGNNNGVNRVQILSLSTDSKENFDKIKFMLDKLDLRPGSFLLCADLKVINISLNIMTHSARHPCP